MTYIDTHTHTCFSSDSQTPLRAHLDAAVSLGMPAICITDHQDFDFPAEKYGMDFLFNTRDYFEELAALKEEYSGSIELLIGVELGLQSEMSTDVMAYAASWPFDFIIGSVHLVDRCDPYYREFFEDKTEDEAYRRYFEEELFCLSHYDCYDCAGHIDYIVRYGPNGNKFYSYEKFADVIDEILKTVIDKGKGIECNMAGFKAGLGHPNPTEAVIKRYRELGGEIITLGSDAHKTCHLAYAFDRAKDLLAGCGFEYYTVFRGRKPEFIKL